MACVSDEDRAGFFVFYVDGSHYSEAPLKNTIAPDSARAAMRHFARSGELSPYVDWEEG
jgi:hypothetical protein